MADKPEPISDLQFMGEARDMLEPLTPTQRAVVLFLVQAEAFEGAETIIATATKLRERSRLLDEGLPQCVAWLRSHLNIQRVSFPDRTDTPRAKRRR